MAVIPGEARAKVSLRLVPDQKATTVFRQLSRAVKAAAPPFADVNVRLLTAADPVLVDVDHPALGHIQRAFHEVVGRPPVFVRSGGSLPILVSCNRD
jgi:acetylornithine deacetylase/succinyl-diaminopimelate desuccinylase-like protein